MTDYTKMAKDILQVVKREVVATTKKLATTNARLRLKLEAALRRVHDLEEENTKLKQEIEEWKAKTSSPSSPKSSKAKKPKAKKNGPTTPTSS